LKHVGDAWTFLVMRDAIAGSTRFDEFQKNLDIAPNILTTRLNALVESRMLERRRYSVRPPREEYHLTKLGLDFKPVLQAMLAWGNRHLAPEGESVVVVNSITGEVAKPVVVDERTGQRLDDPIFVYAAGPAAGDRVRRRYPSIQDFKPGDEARS
jgi:DNA-binding HxlR family transcriptional regulator